MKDDTFIDARAICEMFLISRTTLQTWINDNKITFPKPFKIKRALLWKKSEIDEYLENKRVK